MEEEQVEEQEKEEEQEPCGAGEAAQPTSPEQRPEVPAALADLLSRDRVGLRLCQ